ncbi:hypothetical protein ENBRE01_3119 [Enteropsectra breve]|nr:hypothetical protein ENBRE01_3119 [Enteropsectra breve]
MDDLERRLYEKYGTRKLSKNEIKDVLEEAIASKIIDKGDVRDFGDMRVDELLLWIGEMRREFFYSDCLNRMDNELFNTSFREENGVKRSNELTEKILRAYFEYDRMTRVTDTPKKRTWHRNTVLVSAVLLLLMYFSYTPVPY